MSMPKFPEVCPPITREGALDMLLSSIAMEELGLSHIINAEGEKIQYVLGTLSGENKTPASIDQVLAVNCSVKSILDSVVTNQALLKNKMESVLGAMECGGSGPTGPTGPRLLGKY